MFKWSESRTEAISDGVFAVVLTIMVLDIKPPVNDSWAEISLLLRNLLIYLISFGIVSQYWVIHQELFSHVKQPSIKLLITNLYYLGMVCLVPFVTSWISDSDFSRDASIAFALVMLAVDLTQVILFREVISLNLSTGHQLDKHDREEFRLAKVMLGISIGYLAVAYWLPQFLLVFIALGLLMRTITMTIGRISTRLF